MHANFDRLNTRNLVGQYLNNDLPRVIRSEPVLQAEFVRYSHPSGNLGRTDWEEDFGHEHVIYTM